MTAPAPLPAEFTPWLAAGSPVADALTVASQARKRAGQAREREAWS